MKKIVVGCSFCSFDPFLSGLLTAAGLFRYIRCRVSDCI